MSAQVSNATSSSPSVADADQLGEAEPEQGEPQPDVAPASGHGYITNGELLAWLANVTSGRYDEMRSLMFDCDGRRQLQKDLGQLRAQMDETKVDGDQQALLDAANELLEQYGGTAFAPELEALLAPMVTDLTERTAPAQVIEVPNSLEPDAGTWVVEVSAPPVPAQKLDAWGASLQSEIDSLAKQDQLMLINIQEIQGQINQQTQLASNLVAASARTLDNTVANIRG